MDRQVTALPPLRQASVFDVARMAVDERETLGLRVLVMRVWPRGISWGKHVELWLPDAGPSLPLLQAYHRGEIDWDTFAQRYSHEQLFDWKHAGYYKVGKGKAGLRTSTLAPLQQLRELRRQHSVVTVMCHEREPEPCHRYVLVAMADEILVGDHVRHKDTAEEGQVLSCDAEGYIRVRLDNTSEMGDEVRYHVSEVVLI